MWCHLPSCICILGAVSDTSAKCTTETKIEAQYHSLYCLLFEIQRFEIKSCMCITLRSAELIKYYQNCSMAKASIPNDGTFLGKSMVKQRGHGLKMLSKCKKTCLAQTPTNGDG